MHRTVITGLGVVSPIGSDLDTFWSNLVAGVNGVGQITHFDTTNFPVTIAAEVKGFDVNKYVDGKEQRRSDTFSHYAIGAAKMAIDDSGFNTSAGDPFRHGCIIASGIGGIVTTENEIIKLQERGPTRVSPFCIPQILVNMASGLVAIEHNLKGPNYAVVSASVPPASIMSASPR